ncbi:2-amino-3,7-dideoxy-D-threo-hept-6-ulosonate synthase [Nibrella saemangeumensis]|uniref:2-amino-3,7-dideoxy-D-threo-hept-6-ulosonate synthase n=1 Tax=Nibrella saemangeumensis TaxID=1084526 RepID=A0ABP8N813_9BACT
MSAGKKIRWSRFIKADSKKGIIVPIDHGLSMGPLDGINNVQRIANWIEHPAANGMIAHKGMIERLAYRGLLNGKGVMMHLNGMTSLANDPTRKELLTSIESALRLGADGVSVELLFNGANEPHNLKVLGQVVDEAMVYGLPVLVMIKDMNKYEQASNRINASRQIIRTVYELGADAVKIQQPEDTNEIPAILDELCDDIAVFLAGGAKCADVEILAIASLAIKSGATGLCIGRNVFQRPDFSAFLSSLHSLVHTPLKNAAYAIN